MSAACTASAYTTVPGCPLQFKVNAGGFLHEVTFVGVCGSPVIKNEGQKQRPEILCNIYK